MIGSPENDAALRLECWRTAMQMDRANAHDAGAVDKLSTQIYTFIATEAVSPAASVPESRDKSTKTPKR